MKEFTAENMIQECQFYTDKKDRDKLYDSFWMMAFHGFISEKTWDDFTAKWGELRLKGLI